jgi:hypothetical protein
VAGAQGIQGIQGPAGAAGPAGPTTIRILPRGDLSMGAYTNGTTP